MPARHLDGPLSPRSHNRPAAALLALLAFIAPATLARAQTAIEWSQYQGGPGHPAAAPEGPEPPYRVRWSFPAPDGTSLSGAVISDGIVITVGREAVYGVEIGSRDIAWEVPRAGGPLSVPAIGEVAGARVLLYLEGPEQIGSSPTPSPSPTPEQEEAAEGSSLVAMNLEGPSERWRLQLSATARSGVTVDGEVAYVGDQDGVVHAVSLDDGIELWASDVDGRADLPIAAGDGRVYVVSRDVDEGRVLITALGSEDGQRIWRVSPQIGSTAVSAPAVAEGGVVVGTADRIVQLLDPEAGERRWSALALSLFSPATSPASSGDVIIADVGGGLYRLDVADGSRRWGFQFNELILRSAPVVSGQAVLVGLNDGRLAAVSLETGRLVWESEATRGLVGTIAVAGDAIVAVKGGPDAGLIAFEPDPDGVLVDVPSPTELELGTTLGRVGLAAAAVLVAMFLPASLARRRFGNALEPDEEEWDEEDEEEA